jgi:hypothetical protein
MRLRLILALCLLIIVLVSSSCVAAVAPASSFDKQLNAIVQPYTFNFASWEFDTLLGQLKRKILNPQPGADLNPLAVLRYFSYAAEANTLQNDIQAIQAGVNNSNLSQYEGQLQQVEAQQIALQQITEETISQQISATLASLGIYNPAGNLFDTVWPPVNFKLEKPLYMLIISPRDKIQIMDSITIEQDISQAQIEQVEESVDSLNVSSLIVQIGGLGVTYPTFVTQNANLKWTIETAVHEWLHQYLAFKPLGFGYVLELLGLPVNPSIVTINETVASMAGKEIGDMVYNKYYAPYQNSGNNITATSDEVPATTFDFNEEMRQIRLAVDSYLADGQVDQAEAFMREKQQYLAANGYYIRKLNQAYFAFYGSYADSPTSVDPIGTKLALLREHSASVTDFVRTASGLRNTNDLDKALMPYESGSN